MLFCPRRLVLAFTRLASNANKSERHMGFISFLTMMLMQVGRKEEKVWGCRVSFYETRQAKSQDSSVWQGCLCSQASNNRFSGADIFRRLGVLGNLAAGHFLIITHFVKNNQKSDSNVVSTYLLHLKARRKSKGNCLLSQVLPWKLRLQLLPSLLMYRYEKPWCRGTTNLKDIIHCSRL
jgi:hypothetical protein